MLNFKLIDLPRTWLCITGQKDVRRQQASNEKATLVADKTFSVFARFRQAFFGNSAAISTSSVRD